ncbi:MAG: hypothetical protein QOH27_4725, partial [Mycobacterium sp.]|nr:hypothetical protein [Mycobacterium sp.]
QDALVLYGRCDEDLGAPYQPFAEALRSLVPSLGAGRLRRLRGVEALLPLVPGLVDVVPDLAAPTRADPDTERYALFDAVVALFEIASINAPVVLILDDLHWAAKPTLLLLRHLLRFGERARMQIVGTYRSTDLDRSHPLAAMLADLHRDGTAHRLQLSGLDEDDVTTYVAEAGYDDEELARALASVTGGNPFFLIEALRHVDESGGVWDQSTLPQGVREAVGRRLSRLPAETNKALAAAAVVGSRFAVEFVEHVVERDLVDAFDEACQAGIVIEEPGGHYRFNHALVRQSLLAELPSVRRMRLHQRIAATLENEPGADDELLAELAHHYFECAWAGNAAKAVEYCRRAADQAMARLAYEGAADLYDHALHALEELDEELPNRDDQTADLLVARCEALLAAGDVASAAGAVSQLKEATRDSTRRKAWATCFDGQLSMLIHPERLDDVELALGAAAIELAGLGDAAGEATAHTVRAACLTRLGRIADGEVALDEALTAARRAGEHRRVNAVLAGAPLAALWGPNPVPRAGGRCLDVVRLLRITTDSPAVEATSTRCQAVLEAFRGRATAARRMIESARRSVTELGLRHARLEVEQFAGIVELVADDPAAAEPHLRKAYNGFRRMGLDADTAETAALLGRTCLALDRPAEADELCLESERLAGHALKASIAWRTLRAELLARRNEHDEARPVAEAAVSLAERTDALVDHGDACLALAIVLGAAGKVVEARAAAERAAALYEQKGAGALVEKAHRVSGQRAVLSLSAPPEAAIAELDNACVRAVCQLDATIDRKAWSEYEAVYATDVVAESRRKIVGVELTPGKWPSTARHLVESGTIHRHKALAVRAENLALFRVAVGTEDVSPGAPRDEVLGLYGLNKEGHIGLAVWFDIEDIDAAMAELEATHARFEELRPHARLDNAASRVVERYLAHFATRDWDEMTDALADDLSIDDRRHVVNSGVRTGRDSEIANVKFLAEGGCASISSVPIATRGEHLVLARHSFTVSGWPEVNQLIDVVEIDGDNRIAGKVAFDADDIDAAFEELDARYLGGEAAEHAGVWQLVMGGYDALNRLELPATTPDWVNIDHRRVVTFEAGDLSASFRAMFDLAPEVRIYVEAIHRLSTLGAVVGHVAHGASQEGFAAEWREVSLLTFEGNLIDRCEIFDEADLDVAIARFDELSLPAARLENTTSQLTERYLQRAVGRDWDAIAEMLAGDYYTDDRRHLVGGGIHGRDAEIASVQAQVNLGVTDALLSVIAIRGERLALSRLRYSGRDQELEAFVAELLVVFETNADDRFAAAVAFDLVDIDAALAELDARYLAGEAAAHARTWSTIMSGRAALNQRELPPVAPNFVSIDHRRVAAFAPGEMEAYLRAGIDLDQNIRTHIEVVHRLSDLGAVCTHSGHGVSHDGFDAEWRGVDLLTVEGDTVSRAEIFDETDLEAAIARFDEVSRPTRRLENTASQICERLRENFAARDWDAITQTLADDVSTDDRRHVVNAGLRQGRDAVLAEFEAAVGIGARDSTSDVIAIRGERLVLSRFKTWGRDKGPDAFHSDVLDIVELNADEKMLARLTFDFDDFEAAIAELDARYLAGEAARNSHTWSVITDAFTAISRHELPATTADYVIVDHQLQHTTSEASGLAQYLHASWDLTPNLRMYVEAVHQLSDVGAVITLAIHGTSRDGFDANWRIVELLTGEGEEGKRCEVFNEADLDAALARFDELSDPAPRLENAASRLYKRFQSYFTARDWDALVETMAVDIYRDDRRRVVNAEANQGRDAAVAEARAVADVGAKNAVWTVIAIRGECLALIRSRFSGRDQRPEAFHTEFLCVIEVDRDGLMAQHIMFDPDDFDAAFEELDARYLAGEAAAHARTWSAIAGAYAALNRREIPATTPDWVNLDHRRVAAIAPGDLIPFVRAAWELERNIHTRVETVHRMKSFGAAVTRVSNGTSREGFDAEWRSIDLMTVDGDLISRFEMFDEADLDTALARFDELSRPAQRLENAASRLVEHFLTHFAARDWDAMAESLAADYSSDDRRLVVGAGVRHGRDAAIDNYRAMADVGFTNISSTVIATRGQRLAVTRAHATGVDPQPEAFRMDLLVVVEIDSDQRVAAVVVFEADDVDAAFTELDARYLTGDAAAHRET